VGKHRSVKACRVNSLQQLPTSPIDQLSLAEQKSLELKTFGDFDVLHF
jgi:hypothetical protein